jgi:hypothetical protein
MKNKMFGIVVGASALFMSSGLIAGEEVLFKWGADAQTLKKEWNGKIKYEDIDGKLCGVVDNKNTITTKKFIPVKAGKKYTLSGSFKSLGNETSRGYYGFITYDKKKRHIATINANTIPGSATTLARDCKKGDKTVLVKANKKWKINNAVAFNAKDDFSDLPNYEIAYKILKIVPENGNMKLQLSATVKKAYPAGTKVRAHTAACGSYLYTVISGSRIPKTWKAYSKSAVLGNPGQIGSQFFRPGTAFVKILILPNYVKKKDEKIAFTALSLKVAE